MDRRAFFGSLATLATMSCGQGAWSHHPTITAGPSRRNHPV